MTHQDVVKILFREDGTGTIKIIEAKALWKTSRGHVSNDCIAAHLHKQTSFALIDQDLTS